MDTQAWKGSKKALPTGSSLRRAATDSPFTSSGSETPGHKACALKHSPLGHVALGRGRVHVPAAALGDHPD